MAEAQAACVPSQAVQESWVREGKVSERVFRSVGHGALSGSMRLKFYAAAPLMCRTALFDCQLFFYNSRLREWLATEGHNYSGGTRAFLGTFGFAWVGLAVKHGMLDNIGHDVRPEGSLHVDVAHCWECASPPGAIKCSPGSTNLLGLCLTKFWVSTNLLGLVATELVLGWSKVGPGSAKRRSGRSRPRRGGSDQNSGPAPTNSIGFGQFGAGPTNDGPSSTINFGSWLRRLDQDVVPLLDGLPFESLVLMATRVVPPHSLYVVNLQVVAKARCGFAQTSVWRVVRRSVALLAPVMLCLRGHRRRLSLGLASEVVSSLQTSFVGLDSYLPYVPSQDDSDFVRDFYSGLWHALAAVSSALTHAADGRLICLVWCSRAWEAVRPFPPKVRQGGLDRGLLIALSEVLGAGKCY